MEKITEDGERHNPDDSFYWFKPKTIEECEMINEAFPDGFGGLDPEYCIGKWICCEVGWDSDVWYSNIDDSIIYATELFNKLGYSIEIKEKK